MKKKIVSVVIAAIIDGNKFLMTKRVHLDPEDYQLYHDSWQLPGGGLEFGETPEQTLHREIKEEIGADVKILGHLPKIYTEVRRRWQGIFLVYLCKLNNPKAKITLNDEASEYAWNTTEQAAKLKTLPGTIDLMKDAIALDRKLEAASKLNR